MSFFFIQYGESYNTRKTQLISCVFMSRCIPIAEWWEWHYGGRKFGWQTSRTSVSMRGLRMDSRGPEYNIIGNSLN